jgi:hypothetical protein
VTIRRGGAWGAPGPLPAHGVVVRSDAEARQVVEEARRAGRPVPPLGLLGGDLCRTLGGGRASGEERLRSEHAVTFPADLGAALVDGRLHWFVAHLVARRSWWRGRVVAAMNAEWRGDWDVAPRAHPDDGLLDVVDADLPQGDRWKARRRLRTGTHLPHPDIEVRRVRAWQADLEPPLDVWLDGVALGRARTLSVRVEPDVLTLVV